MRVGLRAGAQEKKDRTGDHRGVHSDTPRAGNCWPGKDRLQLLVQHGSGANRVVGSERLVGQVVPLALQQVRASQLTKNDVITIGFSVSELLDRIMRGEITARTS